MPRKAALLQLLQPGFLQALLLVTGKIVRCVPAGQDQHSPPLRGSKKLPLGQNGLTLDLVALAKSAFAGCAIAAPSRKTETSVTTQR